MRESNQKTNRHSGTTSSFFLGAFAAAVVLGTIGIAYVFLPRLFGNTSDDAVTTNTDGLVPSAFNSTSLEETSSVPSGDITGLRQYKSDFARSVALLSILGQASESQVLALLEQSKSIANPYRRLSMQSDILRRLAILDPVQAMTHATQVAWNRRAPLVRAIFSEWVHTDFEAAVAHARGLVDSDLRVALEVILKSRSDWSELEAVDFARAFGHESLALDLLEQAHVASAVDDPEAAWNAILNDSRTDDEQTEALSDILEYWVMREGSDVISQIEESISHIGYPGYVLSSALGHLTEIAPQNTFELARNLGDNISEFALRSVSREWAGFDPQAALDAVSTIDDGVLRNQLMGFTADRWGALNPRDLLENLSDFPENLHHRARGSALSNLANESPLEAAQLMLEIQDGVKYHGFGVIASWSRQDALGALDWILSRPQDEQQRLLSGVLYYVVQEDPQRALEIALSTPIPKSGPGGLEQRVINMVAQIDVDQAIAMLPKVRDHASTKTFSYVDVCRVLMQRNEPFRALDLGLELPEPLQRGFFSNFFIQWRLADIVGIYESIEKLPSAALKSQAASQILTYHVSGDYRPYRYFSDKQLQEIELYLIEDTKE